MRTRIPLCLAVLLILTWTASVRAGTVIRFTDAAVEPGQTFTVDVTVQNDVALGGFVVPFRWSTNDLLFLGVEFDVSRFRGDYVLSPRNVDPDLRLGGIIFVSSIDTLSTPAALPPGEGAVAQLTFRVVGSAVDQYAFVDTANIPQVADVSVADADLGTVIPEIIPSTISIGVPPAGTFDVFPSRLTFRAALDNQRPPAKTLSVQSQGAIDFFWSATWSSTWLTLSPPLGKTPAFPSVSVDAFALPIGNYEDTIRLEASATTSGPILIPVTLAVDSISAPTNELGFALFQCRPSPFVTYHDPQTEIPFNLVDADRVTLMIYDALGRRVRTLVSQSYSDGDHSVFWDGRDERGVVVASGRYFYRMVTSRGSQTRPLIVIK